MNMEPRNSVGIAYRALLETQEELTTLAKEEAEIISTRARIKDDLLSVKKQVEEALEGI